MEDKDSEDKRERKLTDKGRAYSQELKSADRVKHLRSLEIISSDLERLMLDSGDPKVINPIYKQWISLYEQLLAIHEQYHQLVDNEYEKQVDNVWFQDLNSKFVTLNENIQKWFTLNQTPPEEYDNKSGISRTSRRPRGSSSVSSQLLTARLKEEQRKAELLARAKPLADRQELEEQKLNLRVMPRSML